MHNLECILNHIYNHGFFYSSFFLEINTNYILTFNCNLYGDSGLIIVIPGNMI